MAALGGLDRRRVGALWRLKGRLTLRQFSREPGRIIGAVLAVLIFVPLFLAAAVGSAVGYLRLPAPWPAQLLGLVLVGLWFIWLVFPIIFTALNESVDVTRLLIYPLARRDLIAGILLGTLFDYPTYLMLPMFVAVLVGWGGSLALPIVVLAILLSYGHMVMIGLLVSTALGGVLRSRRFRDVAIIISALLGSSCYFLQVGFTRLAENFTEEQLLAFRPLPILQWFPTGAAAQAIVQASAGNWGGSLLWLGYAAVLLTLVTWAWWQLLVRLTTGEGFLFSRAPRPQQEAPSTAQRAPQRPLLRWLPADVAELVVKELRMTWRTPQRRVGLLQGVLLPFIMIGAFFFSSDLETGQFTSFPLGLAAPFYALFIFWATTSNMLGWEGKGLPVLFLTPLPRHRIFLGKGVALFLISAVPFLLVTVVLVLVDPGWISAAGVLAGLVMGLATLGVTAVFSVWFPSPINLSGRRRNSAFSFRGGCLTALANFFLLGPAILLVAAPVGLPLGLAYFLDRPWIAFATFPLALLYGLLLFWGGARLAGRWLAGREPEVLAATRVEEGEEE